jgi:hypothetical protein
VPDVFVRKYATPPVSVNASDPSAATTPDVSGDPSGAPAGGWDPNGQFDCLNAPTVVPAGNCSATFWVKDAICPSESRLLGGQPARADYARTAALKFPQRGCFATRLESVNENAAVESCHA